MTRRLALIWLALLALAAPAAAKVLRVGTYHHIKGQYTSIQAAVNHAKPGDYVLVAPGDYKTTSITAPKGYAQFPAGVLIQTPRITVRGMSRGGVIVDGTKSGPACSSAKADQNFGPTYMNAPAGDNGVMVWKADNVTVQNLTSCNFLGGSGDAGNEIWWNGGADSGKVGGWGFNGDYLTTTSTYYGDEKSAAQYGVFSSNWDGGTWNYTYGSNFNDSGMYIGACQQICNQVVNHAWMEYNALGYSGSNSGGSLVVENSQFDNNEDGFDTNSQNGDDPSPQNGSCPNGATSPITHTTSCWVFMHNWVHDNNNPNIPSAGAAAAGPVGTGMSISGGRNDTIMNNVFENNGAWGIIIVPYPDSGPPCTGGVTNFPGFSCLFDEWGDAVLNNQFKNDGFFGNNTNGQFDQVNLENNEPTDCYSGNVNENGSPLSSDAQSLETKYPVCNGQNVNANTNLTFLEEVACDSQIALFAGSPAPCTPADKYPRRTTITMHPLPAAKQLPGMRSPCAGVPANPWCTKSKKSTKAKNSVVAW